MELRNSSRFGVALKTALALASGSVSAASDFGETWTWTKVYIYMIQYYIYFTERLHESVTSPVTVTVLSTSNCPSIFYTTQITQSIIYYPRPLVQTMVQRSRRKDLVVQLCREGGGRLTCSICSAGSISGLRRDLSPSLSTFVA